MKNVLADKFIQYSDGITNSVVQKYDDLIDFRIGDPDLITSPVVCSKAFDDAIHGYTHYMGSYGDPVLIDTLIDFFDEEFDISYKKENFMITASGSHAMWLAMQVTLNKGDEVILTDPCFDSYCSQVEDAGGTVVRLPLYEEEGWLIDPKRLESLITPKTKGIVINTPNNPCAVSYPKELLEEIATVAIKHDLLVYADDIYTIYNYKNPFVPIASIEGMKERTITVRSFSKDYVMTGWRLGCIIASKEIIDAAAHFNGHIVYSAPSVSQRAAIEALNQRNIIQPVICNEFKKRAVYALERIATVPYMQAAPLDSSIYLFINITASHKSSKEFCDWLYEKAHVGLLPGSAFGSCGEGYVRLALTCGVDVIKEAFDRIDAL